MTGKLEEMRKRDIRREEIENKGEGNCKYQQLKRKIKMACRKWWEGRKGIVSM